MLLLQVVWLHLVCVKSGNYRIFTLRGLGSVVVIATLVLKGFLAFFFWSFFMQVKADRRKVMRQDKEICSQGKSANFLKQMPMLLAPSCSWLKAESKFIIKELSRHADCTHISLKGNAYKVKKNSQYHSLLKHRSNNPPSFLPAQTALSTPVYTQLHFFLLYYLCILYT